MYTPIEKVKARYQDRLFQYPGVVSVGFGRGEGGEQVILVGLIEELSADTRRRLPPVLEGYAVQIEVLAASALRG